ncbi:hypothetical protein AA0119_g13272, partial [Alternaria tenuissima]
LESPGGLLVVASNKKVFKVQELLENAKHGYR